MSSEPKKWIRHTQKTRKFPENKYHFSQHLERPGDWVETHPIPDKDAQALQHAAWKWAWWHKYTVKTNRWALGDGFVVRVTLVKKHRNRDYA